MAYEKQNFEDGKTLFAEQLNHMEAGIAQNASDIASTKIISEVGFTREANSGGNGKTRNTLEFFYTDGTNTCAEWYDGRDGVDGTNGHSIFPWDSSVGSVVDEDGVQCWTTEGVTFSEEHYYLIVGDLLLTSTGEMYRVASTSLANFTVEYLFTLRGGGSAGSGSSSIGGSDMSAYALKTWVQSNYQPIGDYLTEVDTAEIVNAVLAALPTWNGGSY